MFKTSDYSIPKPAIATTVMVQKQDLVRAKYGTPLFREFDHDGLLLDLFGTYTKQDGYEVMEVAITGTRFSVLALCNACLIKDMNAFCERRHLEEEIRADKSSQEELNDLIREMQS